MYKIKMLYRVLHTHTPGQSLELFNHEPLPRIVFSGRWNFFLIEFRSPFAEQFRLLDILEKQKFTVFVARQIARRFPDIFVWTRLFRPPKVIYYLDYIPIDILSQPAEFFFQTQNELNDSPEMEINFFRRGTDPNSWSGDVTMKINVADFREEPEHHETAVYYAKNPLYTDFHIADEILADLDTVIMDLLDLRFNRYPRYQVLFQNTSFLQMLKSVTESERDLEPYFEETSRTRDRTMTDAEKNKRRREAMMIFLLQQSTIPREITSQFPFPGSPQEFLNGLRNV
jgi:hypothetical protein